jgi:hypothetical protein
MTALRASGSAANSISMERPVARKFGIHGRYDFAVSLLDH